MLAGLSRHLIVLAIALLLMPVVLLACNLSPTGNGCTPPTPPSVPTATPEQRFKVGQQINVNNMYVVSLESAKTTMLTGFGPVLEVQLATIDLSSTPSSVNQSQFTLSSPTGQSYNSKVDGSSSIESFCGGPAHRMFDIMFEVPLAAHRFVLMLPTGVAFLGSLVWDISA